MSIDDLDCDALIHLFQIVGAMVGAGALGDRARLPAI